MLIDEDSLEVYGGAAVRLATFGERDPWSTFDEARTLRLGLEAAGQWLAEGASLLCVLDNKSVIDTVGEWGDDRARKAEEARVWNVLVAREIGR